jgi:hypothetical protein
MGVVFSVRFAGVALALFIASFISLPSFPNPAAGRPTSNPAVTVDRTLKGDRLPLVAPLAQPHELGLPLTPPRSQAREKVPVGCDGAFSSISAPRLENVFRRCVV